MKKLLYLLLFLIPTIAFSQRIVDLSGMVQPGAGGSITASTNTITLSTTAGSASNITSFTTSGTGLSATGAASTPGTWVEISLDQINWAAILNLSASGGIFVGQPITIYVRLTSIAPANTYSGDIVIASTGSTSKNVTVNGTVNPPSVNTNDTVQVNVWDSVNNIGKVNLAAPNLFNEWNINENTSPSPTSYLFKYKTGVQSPITTKFDAINSYVDNGAGYNSSTTSGFPVAGFRVALFNTTTPNTFTIQNLPTATNGYKVIFVGSRSTATSRPMSINIGATTVTHDAMNNDANFTFDNLTPSSGTLTFTFSSTNGFWFLNQFMIIKKN